MGSEARGNRLLMTGMRRSGETDYQINIFGAAPTRFPPMQVRMTLGDLQRWLHEMRTRPEPDGTPRPATLRIVG